MADFPESYKDPLYASLDSANEQKYSIPVGLLSSIRTEGEKSNASQVSSASAKTPYQFTPSTRKAILDKFGIDVTLSPENASEGAGLLLRDSLKRNDGDIETAVREYHGGTNPKNWGPINNAYAQRILAGQESAKLDALGAGFSKFLAANPAVPDKAAVLPQPQPEPVNSTPLSQGFGNWLADKQTQNDAAAYSQKPADPTLVDKLIGAGETGLTLATGATTGAAGLVGGTVKGLAQSVMDGSFGTQQGVKNVENAAADGMNSLTYQPRTESGQQQAAAVGDVMNQVVPVMPLTNEVSAIGRAAAPAAQAVGDAAASSMARIRAVTPAIADRVAQTLKRNPVPDSPTPGTKASVASSGTDIATQRQAVASDLPVPIQLTKGQAERSFEQQRFEREMAKDPNLGEPLRNRYAEQNEKLMKNFDAWVDQSGAEAPNLRAVGQSVDSALVGKAARDKAEIRVAYKNAEKAGELEAPVTLDSLVQHLNESAPDAATAPLLNVARSRALQLGIAAEDGSGQLVPQPVTLKTAETMRQAISRATDYEATNIRQSAIIKGLIDTETEGAGGDLYRQARSLRSRYANQYENRAVISSLLNNKKGMADRKVAFEDVFDHSILKGSLDDVRQVRKVLQTGGPSGQQAWKELQGATINWLKDEATKNVATDTRGNAIVSADKLNKAIRTLDADGKLEYVFGKKGAQQLRDINDLAKVVYTSPPGSVNTSNTASVILSALAEAGVNGSLTGLPIPVLTGLRLLAVKMKDRRIQKRIDEALNNRSTKSQPIITPPMTGRVLH